MEFPSYLDIGWVILDSVRMFFRPECKGGVGAWTSMILDSGGFRWRFLLESYALDSAELTLEVVSIYDLFDHAYRLQLAVYLI